MSVAARFRTRRRAIGLTPLIDVVFILLLFFMLSTSFAQRRQIPIALPAPVDDPQAREVRLLELEREDGTVLHAGRSLRIGDRAALRAWVSEEPEAVVAVAAAPGVRTQTLVDLLDALERAGTERIALAGGPS